MGAGAVVGAGADVGADAGADAARVGQLGPEFQRYFVVFFTFGHPTGATHVCEKVTLTS